MNQSINQWCIHAYVESRVLNCSAVYYCLQAAAETEQWDTELDEKDAKVRYHNSDIPLSTQPPILYRLSLPGRQITELYQLV